MRRRLSEYAKIIDAWRDSATHQMLPDAVDDHAADQRIGGSRQLARQLKSAAADSRLLPPDSRPLHRLRYLPGHHGANRLVVAPNQEVLIDGRAIPQSEAEPRLAANPLAQLLSLLRVLFEQIGASRHRTIIRLQLRNQPVGQRRSVPDVRSVRQSLRGQQIERRNDQFAAGGDARLL